MYVIIGANGFLGTYLIKNILENTQENILAVDRHSNYSTSERIQHCVCDITNENDVISLNKKYLSKNSDNKIIYLAAYHHPDLVDKNPKIAWDTNITALSSFLNIVDNVKCLFYPSSDSVYGDGGIDYYFKETDNLNPVNLYGRHKCIAECLVNGYGYNVVRFPFLIAPSLVLNKKHFYDEIVDSIIQGKTFDMFSDSFRSALDFNTAAYLLIQLIEKYTVNMPGIINVAGDEALSKYDIGLMIADKLKVPHNLIRPISIENTEGIFGAKRAASTLLDNTLVKKILNLDKIQIKL